jgi:hypothetical protein
MIKLKGNLICKMGLHKVSKWQAVSICEDRAQCDRCGTTCTRSFHEWEVDETDASAMSDIPFAIQKVHCRVCRKPDCRVVIL